MTNLKSAILGALMLLGASGSAGCGTGAAARGDWEAELRGALSPDCRNFDHLGYGMHYDIVLTDRHAVTREAAGVPLRPGRRAKGE